MWSRLVKKKMELGMHLPSSRRRSQGNPNHHYGVVCNIINFVITVRMIAVFYISVVFVFYLVDMWGELAWQSMATTAVVVHEPSPLLPSPDVEISTTPREA